MFVLRNRFVASSEAVASATYMFASHARTFHVACMSSHSNLTDMFMTRLFEHVFTDFFFIPPALPTHVFAVTFFIHHNVAPTVVRDQCAAPAAQEPESGTGLNH